MYTWFILHHHHGTEGEILLLINPLVFFNFSIIVLVYYTFKSPSNLYFLILFSSSSSHVLFLFYSYFSIEDPLNALIIRASHFTCILYVCSKTHKVAWWFCFKSAFIVQGKNVNYSNHRAAHTMYYMLHSGKKVECDHFLFAVKKQRLPK